MFADLTDLLLLPGAMISDRLLVLKETLSTNLSETMMIDVLSSILSESTKMLTKKFKR